ncbi:MAG: ankyrin repeat domain-containing protein [Sedimentisphaerales bacterium]|nr:ankyrin repeat domain-containing protein [Sedimentisphaerales bacterium]
METKKMNIGLRKLIQILLYAAILVLSINNESISEEILSEKDFRVTWLKKNAIQLKSIDPNDEDFSDLEPLARAIGDARIVQLGEQTHGDGATFIAKTRLIKFLHQRLGFNVLAFESGLYDCHKAWDLLIKGTEPYKAFKMGVFGIWGASEQVKPLIEYWGQASKSNLPLELCGFDCQFTASASRDLLIEDVNSLLNKLGTDAINSESRTNLLETLKKLFVLSRQLSKSSQDRDMISHNALSLWNKVLDDARASEELSEVELAFWRQFAASTSTFALMLTDPNASGNLRDEQMARNLIWLVNTVYPNRKIIVWAASSHISRNPPSGTSMGHEVYKVLGKTVYTIAFTAAEGWWKVLSSNVPEQLAPPEAGSVEELLVQAGLQNAFIDFRNLNPDGAWFEEKLIARPFGYVNHEYNWTEMFDAIIFTRNMTGSTIPGQELVNISISAILEAAEKGDLEKVQSLIESGADVNIKNNGGWTPLYMASNGGYLDVAKVLIDKGANVNISNNWGWTPLHTASASGHQDIVKLLLTKGANVKTKRIGGWTALHQAIAGGHRNIVELLVNSGADVNVEKDDGITPLDLAEQNGKTEIVELLRKHGAKE